ncbi:hypothetical protein [Methanosarcina sp.]|uniref:hypothetical protein n=1 Tax=Methanosarcina sp. TaxID=2213 RepID=UPI003C763C9A
MVLKAEKKENLVKVRAYKKVSDQNKKVNKINLVVLAAGLLLTVLGMEKVGSYLLWTGMFVLFITAISGILASGSLRRQR